MNASVLTVRTKRHRRLILTVLQDEELQESLSLLSSLCCMACSCLEQLISLSLRKWSQPSHGELCCNPQLGKLILVNFNVCSLCPRHLIYQMSIANLNGTVNQFPSPFKARRLKPPDDGGSRRLRGRDREITALGFVRLQEFLWDNTCKGGGQQHFIASGEGVVPGTGMGHMLHTGVEGSVKNSVTEFWGCRCCCVCIYVILRNAGTSSTLSESLSLGTGAHQLGKTSWPVSPGDPLVFACLVLGLQISLPLAFLTWVLGLKFKSLCSKGIALLSVLALELPWFLIVGKPN